MDKNKKRLFWLICTLGVLFILFLSFILLLPKIINLEPVKQKIITEFSNQTGAELTFEHAELSLLPVPKIRIHQVGLDMPGKFHGAIKTLKSTLSIHPFSKRKIDLTDLEMENPEIVLPLEIQASQQVKPDISFQDIDISLLSLLRFRIPETQNFVLNIQNGQIRFANDQMPYPWFASIYGRFEQRKDILRIEMSCTSNLWKSIELAGTLDSRNLAAMGRIDLTEIKSHEVIKLLMPGNRFGLAAENINIKTEFNLDSENGLHMDYEGSLTAIGLKYKRSQLKVHDIQLNGNARVHKCKIGVNVNDLKLDDPPLELSGSLLIDQSIPQIRVKLESNSLNIQPIRKEVLNLARDKIKFQKVLSIVKGGNVSDLEVTIHGNTFADLRNPDNLLLKGHMTNGNIFIPKANFDLKNVTGDAVIADRMLKGDNLGATLGSSRGYEGELRLGLTGRNAPFHLDIGLDADLVQLPSILRQFVKHEGFIREIDMIRELKGRANGRLILGKKLSKIKARVETDDFQFSGHYERIPFPITVKGTHFSYFGKTISLEDIAGTLGESSFSKVAGQVDWTSLPDLTITSGQAKVNLEKIYDWLSSIETLHLADSPVRDLEGQMDISGIKVSGLIKNLKNLQYTVSGNVSDLKIYHDQMDGPIWILQGDFIAADNGATHYLTAEKARIAIFDAVLDASGEVKNWKNRIQTDIRFQGNFGQVSGRWISNVFHIPIPLAIRTPLSISQGALNYEEESAVFFTGQVNIQNGPQIFLDLSKHPGKFIIKDLRIKDDKSHATLSMRYQKDEFELDFAGCIMKDTLERLFANHNKPRGFIEGDFSINVPLMRPWQSTARGPLKVQDLFIPWDMGIPVEIKQFDLVAESNLVTVNSARFGWRENTIDLRGKAASSTDKLSLDMEITANQLDWKDISQDLGAMLQNGPKNHPYSDRNWPLSGIVKLKAASLTIDPYTWYPFNVDILLNNGDLELNVIRANLCGIPMPGIIRLKNDELSMDFELSLKNQQLESILGCFLNKEKTMSGRFDLKGNVSGQGNRKNMLQQARGTFEVISNHGRIYSDSVLAKVLTYLNVTEGLWGNLPSIGEEGIGYHSITLKGKVQQGELKITEGIMNGDAMEIVGQGKIDLSSKQLDAVLLLAPLKTVDRIIKNTPIVGRILGGSLVSIPVKVTGDLNDPVITTLPPSEIGAGMIRMLERIVNLPIDIFGPALESPPENKAVQ